MSARNLGTKRLKNVARPVRVYALALEPTDPGSGGNIGQRRLLAIGVGAGLIALSAYIALVRWRPMLTNPVSESSAGPHIIHSIAVLPLDNYSGDPNQEYFADGMTDELTTDLAKISELRVISRGSAMRFKGANRPPTPEIAKTLNVDAVVEGSVLRSGDKVRITAQLIDAPADKHLWADTFERDSRDVLELQDELASAIAKEIAVQLTPAEKERLTTSAKVDPAAHEAYLKGRFFLNSFSPDNLNKAIAEFKHAIALDANFAPPYAGLADAYSDAYDLYTSPSVMPEAKAAVEKAVQLDDSSAEAHAALGYVHHLYDYDLVDAETEYRRAIELGPNFVPAHCYYGFLLALEGRFDDAIVEARKSIDLDPLSATNLVFASFPFMLEGKYDTARKMVRQALELDPSSDFAQWQLGVIDSEAGNFGRAIVELEEARRPDAIPYVDGWLGYAYAASGNRAKALATIKALDEASSHGYVSPFCTAIIYLALGDKDRALTLLEKTYEVHSQWLFLLKVDKTFDPLRKEPRFIALMKKVGYEN